MENSEIKYPDKLIVVMTSGRSGSSLVCGLMERHGLWLGKTKTGDRRNPDGFFENMDIYKACAHYGQFKRKGEVGFAKHDGKWPEQFAKMIKAQGYRKGPVVIKHIPNCWPIWDDMSPVYVTVRRDIEAQVKSRKNINKDLSVDVIKEREKAMDFLENEKFAIRIDANDLINGDYSRIGAALAMAGVKVNKKICQDFINPSYWHY